MISVVILTKNEEKNIKDCIESVLWCDEIIVVDDHSDDSTVEKAKALGAVVYFHDLAGDFATQRNFALGKAKGDWTLFIDADERVSPALRDEIGQEISSRRNRYAGYFVKRTDTMWGRKLRYGESSEMRLIRLARKDSGTWKGKVHEVWDVEGHTAILTEPLMHYPHPTVKEFLAEINTYSDIRAQELHKKRVKTSWWLILAHTKGKFLQNYLVKLGVLDGIPGLVSAIMMSMHAFLVRAKLWLLWNK